MTLWLTPAEVVELTGFKQKSKQLAAVRKMGLKHTPRADCFPLVYRSQFESGERLTKNQRRREPNFTAISR